VKFGSTTSPLSNLGQDKTGIALDCNLTELITMGHIPRPTADGSQPPQTSTTAATPNSVKMLLEEFEPCSTMEQSREKLHCALAFPRL
jgi:hypothetical protein